MTVLFLCLPLHQMWNFSVRSRIAWNLFVLTFVWAGNSALDQFLGEFRVFELVTDRHLVAGDVVRVDSEKVGDLGVVERNGSFTPWHKVCENPAKGDVSPTSARVYESSPLRGTPAWLECLRAVSGLTVNCCTGTAVMAAERIQNFDVDVESMEGAACFSICRAFGMPCFEVRAVSNLATDRDKSTWRIADALKALNSLVNVL